VQVVITAPDGDSTIPKKVEPALTVLMALSNGGELDPRKSLRDQPRVAAANGHADRTGKNKPWVE
jgi:hypothetical protein